MIVEFVGSTGAGKTTFFNAVHGRFAVPTAPAAAASAFEVVAAPLGLHTIAHPKLQNLIQECVSLPFFLRALPRHRELVRLTFSMLARQRGTWLTALSNVRSLERKLGVHEIVRRSAHARIILVDEGPLLLAHNLFVFNAAPYTPQELSRFVALLPRPDVLVYVRAPLDSLVRRAQQRSDRRRELEGLSHAQLRLCVERASALYGRLVDTAGSRCRVLTVDNPDTAVAAQIARTTAVDTIFNLILEATYDIPSPATDVGQRPLPG